MLTTDLEWRLIYVGSAQSEDYDQELDSCMGESFPRCGGPQLTQFLSRLLHLSSLLPIPFTVGPIPAGVNAFEFAAPAPQHHLLPSVDSEEILGVTVIIITASYRDKEFVRVGYYVNTYYEDEELRNEPPSQVVWDKLYRNVLIEKPKVTRFQNPWDSGSSEFAGTGNELEQPLGGNGDVYNSPLPPPVQKAQGMDVDQEGIAA